MHKFSDIINSIINNGIEIEKMEEYNFGCGMELVNNIDENIRKKFPLSFVLNGKKK
jgi:hypothetical protein